MESERSGPRGSGYDPVTRAALADLAGWAQGRLPRLIDDVYDAVVDRVEMYRAGTPVPAEDLRRSVELNLRFMIGAIADPLTPPDLTAPAETGRRRAHQGAPLPEVLRAYRICFAVLWDALVEHVRRGTGARDTLLDAAGMIWQLTDEHALALTEAHRTATAELLLAQQRRRSALVEVLFTGRPGSQAGPWEAAKLLGLPPDGHLVVVAAETRGLAEDSLVGVEHRLGEHGIVSAWRLNPALRLGVVSLAPKERDTVLRVLREVASARAGVSPLYRSLADTPRALHLARVALAGVPAGTVEVRMFGSSPLEALMACEPDEGRRLAEEVLGGLSDLPTEDRALLLDTLNTYLDHGGSADRTAQVLYCHPNTVRYRLRRVHELTGRSLSDPRELAELTSAAYAMRVVRDAERNGA